MSVLATSSTLLDHYLRHINEGFAVGLTSVLIIVSVVHHCGFLIEFDKFDLESFVIS